MDRIIQTFHRHIKGSQTCQPKTFQGSHGCSDKVHKIVGGKGQCQGKSANEHNDAQNVDFCEFGNEVPQKSGTEENVDQDIVQIGFDGISQVRCHKTATFKAFHQNDVDNTGNGYSSKNGAITGE